MKSQNEYFQSLQKLEDYIAKQVSGSILLGYENLSNYSGMVLGKSIIFDTRNNKYELDLEWISFGLDLYGENLLENYLYSFATLDTLLQYLKNQYNITPSDMPMKYKTDLTKFPNPIKDSENKHVFIKSWEQFQNDFRTGIFLDNTLELIFSSTSQDI